MQLEPVYADAGAEGAGAAGPPPAPDAIKVSDEKRQLIGVRIGTVETRPFEGAIRAVGSVAVDESRLYRVIAPVDGVVRQLSGLSTGSVVRKGDLLLSFLPREPDYVRALSVYYYALDVEHGTIKTGLNEEQAKLGLRTATDALVRLGMDETQIADLAKTRKAAADIEVRAPVNGYVVARSVSAQQPLDRGAQLYTIADLNRVWILVDVFEHDSRDLKPGTAVRISRPSSGSPPFAARVGNALQQFDPATRTMKLRLEAENRDYALRPGMFVDAEIPIALPAALTVPADAVVDSGVRRVVYVDRGGGYLEPRRVETGWRFGDRVEIVTGLHEGERIVLSGTFLLDSESRMKAVATGTSASVRDPVCGMQVDEDQARVAGRVASYRGATYFFCSDDCQRKFEQHPEMHAAAK